MSNKREKPIPINREKFLNNLPDPYQIPEQVEQPYNKSNPNAIYRSPGEPDFIRAKEISLKGDTNSNIEITLEDHDKAVLYYIQNYIKPTIEINGNQREIPVIYASPERWKSMQKDGFFRDKNGKVLTPIISLKRESFEKDRRLGNKLDGNKVQNVQYFKKGYSKRNEYDNFSVLQNQKPQEEYQVGVIPDYITITYKLSIFTDYVEHMNSIIEALEFASDSYWGDKERFQFRASITQFPTPIEVINGNDRAIKSDLSLTLNGYIIPKTINVQKAAPSAKSYNTTKFIFKEYNQESNLEQTDIEGNKIITYSNPEVNRVSHYGTFTGNFIGDGSQLTNLPIPIIDIGSLVTTSSFNEFIGSYNTGSFQGNLEGTSSWSENSITSSYYNETDPIFTSVSNSLIYTSSFNNFTASYTTGSFTGSFIGNGSLLTNLPIPTIDTGSLLATSSFNNFTSSYQQDSGSFSFNINLKENISNKNTGSLTNSTSSYTSNFTVSQSLDLKINKTGGILEGLLTFPNLMFGLRNIANTFTSFFTNTNTVSQTYTLQDKTGTIAHLDDIIGNSFNFNQLYRYVALVANNWHSINNNHFGDYQVVYNNNTGQTDINLVATTSNTIVYRVPTKCFIEDLDFNLIDNINDSFAILKSSNKTGINKIQVYLKPSGTGVTPPIIPTQITLEKGDYLHFYFSRIISNQGFGIFNITFKPVL